MTDMMCLIFFLQEEYPQAGESEEQSSTDLKSLIFVLARLSSPQITLWGSLCSGERKYGFETRYSNTIK